METNESDRIEEVFRMLTIAKENAIKERDYEGAEIAHNRLIELNKHDIERQHEALKAKYVSQTLDLEEAYLEEYENTNNHWEGVLAEHDENALEILKQMREKQIEEKREWEENLQNQPFLRPKQSVSVRNMRRLERVLAKQDKYQEAQRLKEKADQVEIAELSEQREKCKYKILHMRDLMKKKHANDLTNQKQRSEAHRNKLERQKSKILNEMELKYNNSKKELLHHYNRDKRHIHTVIPEVAANQHPISERTYEHDIFSTTLNYRPMVDRKDITYRKTGSISKNRTNRLQPASARRPTTSPRHTKVQSKITTVSSPYCDSSPYSDASVWKRQPQTSRNSTRNGHTKRESPKKSKLIRPKKIYGNSTHASSGHVSVKKDTVKK